MQYRPRYFELSELADPQIIAELGERTWQLFRPDALMMLDAIREKFGQTVVNGEFNGNVYTESGLRRHDTKTGGKFSMHKYGGAFDCKFRKVSVVDAYHYVITHPDEFPHINRVENIAATPTWFHWDVGNSTKRILVVNP